ncbi:MAG: thioredoxin domain-containing protein [Elusimicrobia bacterium]|nr:thioredoxin domain-containing protein [Elusimicrobiota bacterium]
MNRKVNRLGLEKSPYLLQHAHNPVDWYPWGEEAFQRAHKENKPVILSIGYSTCHWCHVMERESFENDKIAEIMNREFVAIKLDREERPDIDRIYMTAVQALTGQGGWPLNVFLTPDLKPFFGGTYFPPDTRWGRPGFAQVLEQVAQAWKAQGDRIRESGEQLRLALEQFTATMGDGVPKEAVSFDKALDEFTNAYDAAWGGFGSAPKFPMPVNHNLLLRLRSRTGDKKALDMSAATLKAMAAGGIYDHIGGGFHRYSTDEQWHVPHFEKMLYDNAQLAVNYIEAFVLTKEPEFARVARETLDYILRDLRHPDGGFFSAEDADSAPPPGEPQGHKAEGAFYIWSKEEIASLLGKDAELFCLRYGVRPGGNVMFDPQNEFGSRNVLYLDLELQEAAHERKTSVDEAQQAVERGRRALFEARATRKRPDLDDKVLVSWNALAITALAKASQALGEKTYLEAAQAGARFLHKNLWNQKTHRLARRWRDGEAGGPAVADDYAFLIQSLIDLYETDFDPHWLEWALELTDTLQRLFYDPIGGGYYMTASDHDARLLVRMKESQDNVEPSASSVAAIALLRLSVLTGREDLRDAADKTLELFADQMKESPRSLPQMLVALDFHRAKAREIVVAGELGAPDTEALLSRVRARLLPHAVIVLADGGDGQKKMARWLPFLKDVKKKGGKATAYVCTDYACQAPVTDPSALDELLIGLELPKG